MKKLILWFRTLYAIVRTYHNALERIHDRLEALDSKITSRTAVGIDIGHPKDTNYIIAVGHYGEKDYVEVFPAQTQDFRNLVDHLHRIRKTYGRIAWVDAPPVLRAVIDREGLTR